MEFFIAKKYRSFNFSLEWYGNEIGELKVFACKQFGKPKTDEEFLEMCKEYNIVVEKFKSYLQDIEYTLEKRPNILLTVLGTMQADFRDFNFKIKYFDKDGKTTYKV